MYDLQRAGPAWSGQWFQQTSESSACNSKPVMEQGQQLTGEARLEATIMCKLGDVEPLVCQEPLQPAQHPGVHPAAGLQAADQLLHDGALGRLHMRVHLRCEQQVSLGGLVVHLTSHFTCREGPSMMDAPAVGKAYSVLAGPANVLSPQVELPDLFSIYDYVAAQRPWGPSQETWLAFFYSVGCEVKARI